MDANIVVTVSQPCVDEPPIQPILIVKNLPQMIEVTAFERMLTAIYGSDKPTTLADLLERIDCDRLTIRLLKHLAYAPICSDLLESLRLNMTTTNEGKRLFEVSQMLFGFYGSPSTNTAISVKLRLSPAEAKQALVRLKARLQAPQVRQLLEQILREQLAIFKRSGLCQALLQQQKSFISSAPIAGQWSVKSTLSAEIQIPNLVQKLMEAIAVDSSINISGGSGTGKTTIAMEVAQRLSESGKKVLLVNHSRMLAAQLRNQYQEALAHKANSSQLQFQPDGGVSDEISLTISTFHALCHAAALSADLKTPKFRSTKVFNEVFPELLEEAVQVRPDLKFDAIVIDEGHSFGTNLWRALKSCLRRAGDPYLFFYDPQLLQFNRNSVIPHAARSIALTENFKRNMHMLETNETSELYEVTSEAEQTDTVQFIVEQLLAGGKYLPSDIAILSASNEKKSHKFKIAGIKISQQPVSHKSRPAVMETSLFQFRALTTRVVILIDLNDELDKLNDWKLQYFSYLVWGRATDKLILVGSHDALRKLLPREVSTLATAEIVSDLKPKV